LRYGELVALRAREHGNGNENSKRPWTNTLDADRCLRVGLVSGDFRIHPVGYFIENVLAALAADASARMEVVAYSTHSSTDALTEKIKGSCHGWRSAFGMSDEALAECIRNDGIDILIDLSGHTGHNRLPVFAWKPAPIQASWLGYVATSGMATMDYYIADRHAVPEWQEAQFVEKVWRLPESMNCFTPPAFNHPVSPTPALANGYITFGSFNNLTKMNDRVVALWASVLANIPHSKLLLNTKQLSDAATREATWQRFADAGIGRERVLLEYITPRANSVAAYSRVDIALDPFPYNGGTTTAEALWMGVPVLTLAGERLAGRMGVSQLSNVGLQNWIAESEADYVAKAAQLCDIQALATLRAGLRQQALASPLFDAPRFAGHFAQALRGMWLRWLDERAVEY
ncbi:MAG TPA: peptide-binding protein, partial [Burkholderiaceae bacterium]